MEVEEILRESRAQDEVRLLKKQVALKRSNGLAFYQPSPKQALFHSAAKYKRRYLRTGNRFGKSTCGAAEDVAYALGARIWLPKDHPDRQVGIPKRSTKGLIIVSDWDKAREIFTNQQSGASRGKLFKLIPEKSFKGVHKNQSGEIDCIYIESMHGGISSIYLDTVKSFMSNPMGQESSDWDWIHVDEPCPEDLWTANARGLVDRDGSAWFTCTPLKYMWINDYFIPRTKSRENFPDGLTHLDRWTLTGGMSDNKTLSPEAIQRFSDECTAEERAARIFGHPRMLQGVVYPEFDRSRHLYDNVPRGWTDHNMPPKNYTIRLSIDPHAKTPHAVLFAATAPTGQVFFFHEVFRHQLVDALCDDIYTGLNGLQMCRVICDPIAFQQNPVDGKMWADVLWARGIMAEKAPKDLIGGIQKVKTELSKPDNWYFSSALTETLYEFDRYIWDPKKEKPIDDKDHMMECLYRLALTGLDYVDMTEEEMGLYEPIDLGTDFSLPVIESWM